MTLKNLNYNPMQILDILQSAQEARIDGHNNILSLVPGNSANRLFSILVERPGVFYEKPCRALLESMTEIVEKHAYESHVTDWPFENFWDNPKEPKHSKMIAYFIDPQKHGSGNYMLKKLFGIFNENSNFPDEELESYEVIPETRVDDSYGQIDILIKCKTVSGLDFAVIIENKVNHAPDQPKQLERYVRRMVDAKYEPKNIYVFYLPLTASKNPQESDRVAITKLGAIYNKITFKGHILNWLNAVIDDECSGLKNGMIENICHYKNLIKFLIKKNTMAEINNEILEKLIEQEKVNQKIPSLNEVAELRKSVDALEVCLKTVYHGKLLLEISTILKSKGIDISFRSEDNIGSDVKVDLPYHLSEGMNLCIPIQGAQDTFACFGINSTDQGGEYWIGYLRLSQTNESEYIKKIIRKEVSDKSNQFVNGNVFQKDDSCYYGYIYGNIDYSQDGKDFANHLICFKNNLEARIAAL